jgi:hypothetical protein
MCHVIFAAISDLPHGAHAPTTNGKYGKGIIYTVLPAEGGEMLKSYGAFTGVLCTVALVGAAAPAGPDGDLDGFTARQIADRAKKALDAADSLRLSLEQEGEFALTLDLALDEDNNCAGSIDRGDHGSIELVKRGKQVWMKPDKAFWKQEAGGAQGERVAELLKDRYIRGATNEPMLAGVAGVCDMASFRAESKGGPGSSRWTKGSPATVDGRKTVPITRHKDGSEITLYVAAQGRPYPLKVEREGGTQEGTLRMSDYGKPVPKKTPAPTESVTVSDIRKHLDQSPS